MRQIYEERAANPAEAVKINDLEKELQRTKDYYHKRIRELEDRYKFKANIGTFTEDDKKTKLLTSKALTENENKSKKNINEKKNEV